MSTRTTSSEIERPQTSLHRGKSVEKIRQRVTLDKHLGGWGVKWSHDGIISERRLRDRDAVRRQTRGYKKAYRRLWNLYRFEDGKNVRSVDFELGCTLDGSEYRTRGCFINRFVMDPGKLDSDLGLVGPVPKPPLVVRLNRVRWTRTEEGSGKIRRPGDETQLSPREFVKTTRESLKRGNGTDNRGLNENQYY